MNVLAIKTTRVPDMMMHSHLGDHTERVLIYERKKKRPIQIVISKEEAEEVKAKGEEVTYNPEKDEYIKNIDYREGVEDIAPNAIYK